LLSSSTSASLATAMHDSIVPVDSRPSISSPLASQPVRQPDTNTIPGSETTTIESPREETTATSVSTTSTVDEILPVPTVRITQDSGIKRRDSGSVEEREVVEPSH
jgi:hypothetical protein